MTQIGWAYWADQEVEPWESLVLSLYHIIMTAGERQISREEVKDLRKADDDDYDDHPSTFTE
jgi:hypothetical protein